MQTLSPGSYFGTSRTLHDAGGLQIAETGFPADYDIPPHEHANPFFCFVVEGNGTRWWPGRSGVEGPMALTVFPAALPHANHWYGVEGGRAMHVEFSGAWLARLGGADRLLHKPVDFDRGAPLWLAQRMVQESRHQDQFSLLMLEGLVLEMLAACARDTRAPHSAAMPAWLQRALKLVRERRAERLALTDIADACGVSADHLARGFRRHLGCTVGEHLRALRIEQAAARLARDDASIADIALDAGFTDQSHFTRVFRRQLGTTPAAFRALQRGGRLRTRR